MARFRPSETSPGSSSALPNENAVEPMPRSTSLAILPKLLSPRAVPANVDSRRWLPGVPFEERPFDTSMIASTNELFSSYVAFSSVGCSDVLLRYSISSTPSLELGPSLFRSRIMTEKFPWSSINFVSKCFQPSGWAEWVNHVFCTNKPFVAILTRAGIADAIKASPFLGVHKRSDDLATLVQRWSKMSKVLKAASAEGARHSRKKLALRRAKAFPSTVKFGLDLSPLPLDLDSSFVHEAMRSVLFVERHELLPFDPSRYVPLDRVGRVLDEWVVYQRRLKASIAFFESVKSTFPPLELLILLTDPYYVTSSVDYDKSNVQAKVRVKTTPSQKGKAKLCVSAPPFEKVSKKAPSSAKRPFFQVPAPRRSSERLRARPIQGSLRCPSSPSSGDFSDSDEEGSCEAFGKSQDSPSLSDPPRSVSTQHTSVLHANLVTGLNDSRASEHMPPGQPHAMIRNFSVEVVNLPARVMTPFTGSSSLSLGMHTSGLGFRVLKSAS
ncbi:hypothetical protein SESBI_25273 [Sesbania bispinosa]|nr:hypothetical protein SESBI_25273 [Sesbania bispinosa]